MRLKDPLLKLPVRFCVETLAAEVRALPAEAWMPHPQRFPGNEAVPLITPAGRITNEFAGPMRPTEHLLACPYMMEVMADLGAVWGRGRLMGLGPGGEVPPHVDSNYYWRTHIRVHIPIVTNERVLFTCGDRTDHLAAGECWVLDTFQEHRVENGGTGQRIHLVLDTVGGGRLWDLIAAADGTAEPGTAFLVEPGKGAGGPLMFEQHNFPKIMSPWELKVHIDELVGRARPHPLVGPVRESLDRFVTLWGAVWAMHASSDQGLPSYRSLIDACRKDLQSLGAQAIMLDNQRQLFKLLNAFVLDNAVVSPRVEQFLAAEAPGDALERLGS